MYKSNLEIIRERLDEDEQLAQLAEELTEAAQAALKLRRAKTGVNPTPASQEEAFHNLLEELADVSVCLRVLKLDSPIPRMILADVMPKKAARWAGRLSEKDGV